MKKSIVKPIILSIFGISTVGLIVGTSVDWNRTPLLFASGSSSVQPLIQILTKDFKNSDVIANVGGSGMGISDIARGLKDFGLSSKTPTLSKIGVSDKIIERFKKLSNNEKTGIGSNIIKNLKNQELTNLWGGNSPEKDSATKTITIAWDAITIVYSNDGLPDDTKLNINKNNIEMLFKAFAGYEQVDLIDLINAGTGNSKEKIYSNEKIYLKPYARQGGANASGTADAFLNDNHLKNISDMKDLNIHKALDKGTYGQYTKTTNETNGQAWNTMLSGKSDQRKGKIIYLSGGYVSQNIEEITKNNFSVATFDNVDLIKSNGVNSNMVFNPDLISGGYNWYRPFNIMINIPKNSKLKEDIVKFVSYILDISYKNKELFKNEGYNPLTETQLKSMMLFPKKLKKSINYDDFLRYFFISDYELLEEMEDSKFIERLKNGILFGATSTNVK